MSTKILYTKCEGCFALKINIKKFECNLGNKVTFKKRDTYVISPKPVDKCKKPKTKVEFDKLKK